MSNLETIQHDDMIDVTEELMQATPTEAEIIDIVDRAVDVEAPKENFAQDSALPLKHFRLSAHPFADSVNPEFFFRTEAHEEAFLAMKQCIADNISLGLTTAISGTGKTLLTQVLLKDLDPNRYCPILILAFPGMSKTGLLREILSEMGVEGFPPKPKVSDLVAMVQEKIVEMYQDGLRLVLIIDEVHFLEADTLHIVRTLSNIELPEKKLVTVLLFGEHFFLEKMQKPAFRAIFSRMFTRTEIRPLNRPEIEQYVKFRLLVAGGRPEMFEASAFDPLQRLSGGIPREINRICHNALAIGAAAGKATIDASAFVSIPAAPILEMMDM